MGVWIEAFIHRHRLVSENGANKDGDMESMGQTDE